MFWNEMTVNTMIMVYVAGLFALILICLYALIESKANKLYTFIIIPLALIMASMTWQGIKLLQGMPVYGLPETEVEVMWVNDNKPWIFVVLKKEGQPVLYKIDWSEENKKKMKELQRNIGSTLAQGKFETEKSNKGESQSFFFTPMLDYTEPEEKRGQKEGITYEPARSTNTGLTLSTEPEERTGFQTVCPQSQSFCDDEYDEPAIGGQ
tara:strand:- start:3092 stop:3718 length:627 start_codon:yes stop_codon:yes gene_type:complete